MEHHFNGNVFTVEKDEESQIRKKHLAVVKRYFQNGFEENNLFPDFRLFRFEIIPIELISGIYESLLKSMDARQNRATGTYYTPPALVELVLDDKLPADSENYKMRILDPACGSGIFLVESFRRLVRRYEKAHGEKPQNFETLKTLLVDHIFGIEINFQSIKVAAFSLYLALLENLEPKTLWQEDSCRFPYLIDAPEIPLEKRGKNLYCRDAIEENEEIDQQSFDLIVGNPPFGRLPSEKQGSVRKYCDDQKFAREYSLPFLHKAVKWCPAGEIAFLFPVSILMNTRGSYAKFRSWLFKECYVEKIYNFSVLRKTPKNFGGSLFESATVPVGVVFYRKSPDEFSDRILYYAPKTYIKSNSGYGILIEKCDVRYIRREDCGDSRIWKIAMWGGDGDFALFKRLDHQFRTLQEMVDENSESWITGTGFHKASQQRIREGRAVSIPGKIMDTECISRFYTDRDALRREEKPCNPHDLSRFPPPFVLTKEGQKELRFCASLIDFPAAFLSSAFAIKCIDDDRKNKVLCALINSDFGEYFLRMVSPSWGIERERVIPRVLMLLPDIFEKASEEELDTIAEMVDSIIAQKQRVLSDLDSENLEIQLNEYLFKTILKLNDREKFAVQDALKYNLDMFLHQSESIAMKPVTEEILEEYARVLCNTINEFVNFPHFAEPTLYSLPPFSALMMIKVNFSEQPRAKTTSNKSVDKILKRLEPSLWKAHGNIYLHKTLNYYNEDNVYLIRPNQQRFWTKSMAIEDAESLIMELGGTEE
ncbi:MAG: N-6 DNA methylase [Planctomycetia bacterium]|nr:N-6 DNA methylase [Planctomycetia bacterium]